MSLPALVAVVSALQVVVVPMLARAAGRSGAAWFLLTALWLGTFGGAVLATPVVRVFFGPAPGAVFEIAAAAVAWGPLFAVLLVGRPASDQRRARRVRR